LAEALLLGKPVIATNYSGNLDFCKPEWFVPVDYEFTSLNDESAYAHFFAENAEKPLWADPSVDHAARMMQEVFANLKKYQKGAARGRLWILDHYSEQKTGARLKKRLSEIFNHL
jgi:glycosyltransferase involved in cell wall biosynthesis